MIVKGRLKIRGCGYVARMTPLLAMLALLANDTHSTDTAAAADTHSSHNIIAITTLLTTGSQLHTLYKTQDRNISCYGQRNIQECSIYL